MNSPRRLEDLLDERFGVDTRLYRVPDTPRFVKSPEGGESMDNKRKYTVRRGELKTGVRTLLFDNPDREWHLKEVAEAIGHTNLGSVSSCLNDQHRDPKVAIMRTAPQTYRAVVRSQVGEDPTWIGSAARLIPKATTGDLLEVIGCYNGESIAVDTEGNLLALGTMRVIGRV